MRSAARERLALVPTRSGACLPLVAALLCWGSPPARAEKAPAAPKGFKVDSGYHLVKNWDFRHDIRDERALRDEFYTRFVYGGGKLDHLNDEWSRYRDHDNHVFTSEGLSLVARSAGPPAPGKVESGMLRSRWTGQHGVFEIAMRVPAGRGMWPTFWLNPEDQKWPPEIDVVEIVNNGREDTRRSFHFLHSKKIGKGWTKLDAQHTYAPGVDYAQGFHVFAVEWTADRVRHFVDGTMIADREFSWIHDDGSDGGPAHVLVNLAVGGKWTGPPSESAGLPASLDIEYIRVWQR